MCMEFAFANHLVSVLLNPDYAPDMCASEARDVPGVNCFIPNGLSPSNGEHSHCSLFIGPVPSLLSVSYSTHSNNKVQCAYSLHAVFKLLFITISSSTVLMEVSTLTL